MYVRLPCKKVYIPIFKPCAVGFRLVVYRRRDGSILSNPTLSMQLASLSARLTSLSFSYSTLSMQLASLSARLTSLSFSYSTLCNYQGGKCTFLFILYTRSDSLRRHIYFRIQKKGQSVFFIQCIFLLPKKKIMLKILYYFLVKI